MFIFVLLCILKAWYIRGRQQIIMLIQDLSSSRWGFADTNHRQQRKENLSSSFSSPRDFDCGDDYEDEDSVCNDVLVYYDGNVLIVVTTMTVIVVT